LIRRIVLRFPQLNSEIDWRATNVSSALMT
jgi:hypothetical protein